MAADETKTLSDEDHPERTRRDLLGAGALGAAAAALTGSCGGGGGGGTGGPSVQTDKKVQWRLASSFPNSLDTIYGAAEVLAEHVEAMTGGNFKIRVYQAGEIVPGLQVLDAVQNGTVQVGQTASYYYKGKNPALAFDTCVPFGHHRAPAVAPGCSRAAASTS